MKTLKEVMELKDLDDLVDAIRDGKIEGVAKRGDTGGVSLNIRTSDNLLINAQVHPAEAVSYINTVNGEEE